MQPWTSNTIGERYNSDESVLKKRIPNEAQYGDHYRGRPGRAHCGHRVATTHGDQARSDRGNGIHKYNNQDHSMLTAMTAVENIVNGITTKDNIWAINTGMDYQEEKPEV
jgi:hypothetical protein